MTTYYPLSATTMRTRFPKAGSIAMAFAFIVAASPASAENRGSPDELTYADRLPYVERPITAGRRHLDLHFGVSGEYVDYYRSYSSIGHPLAGVGAHLDATYGVTDYLEFGAGVGLNVPGREQDLPYVNADRYARVNREWLPTGLELARAPYVLGNEYVTNPYLRGRLALLNHRPVYIGLDLAVTLPIAPHSCFTVDLGVPVHIILGHRVRIETGAFNEFAACEVPPVSGPATRYWTLVVPLRVLFGITDRFWMGIQSGFETVGYSLDSRNFAIPLGVMAGVRLAPRVDLLFDVVAPEFVHTDPTTNRNVFLDRIGGGVALQLYLL